jgi:aminomethyltransferase
MLKRTPLYEAHVRLGARLVDFGGWEMPVQYTGIVEEHLAVRRAAGLFDISHMGELVVSGPGAETFLNRVLSNDVRRLAVGQGQYTLLCNVEAGVIDDLYVYRTEAAQYLLVVNATRSSADYDWLQQQAWQCSEPGAFQVRNVSDEFGAIAVQGPAVTSFMAKVMPGASVAGTAAASVLDLRKNRLGCWPWEGASVFVARTGYTGEDGVELVAAASAIGSLWERTLVAGAPFGLKPAGLGARDTLRTEMCYPLYGHELNEAITPLEAGLARFVALDKGPFVGSERLAAQSAQGVTKQCVAFRLTDKGPPPRPRYPILDAANSRLLGEVASGTQSPSLGVGIGLGYVPPSHSQPGMPLDLEVRGRRVRVVVVPKPIYRKTN